jgi:hypothetical protein
MLDLWRTNSHGGEWAGLAHKSRREPSPSRLKWPDRLKKYLAKK